MINQLPELEGNVRKYIPASPDILLYYTRAIVEKHQSIKSGIEEILPELINLSKNNKYHQ